MDDTGEDAINDLLRGYEQELIRLEKQKRLLQDAPTTFGAFASRVKAEIERRVRADRRAVSRGTADRRAAAVPNEVDSTEVEST
jgi:hypothetical protein